VVDPEGEQILRLSQIMFTFEPQRHFRESSYIAVHQLNYIRLVSDAVLSFESTTERRRDKNGGPLTL